MRGAEVGEGRHRVAVGTLEDQLSPPVRADRRDLDAGVAGAASMKASAIVGVVTT